MDTSFINQIRELVLPVLASMGLTLFDVERSGNAVRVILDREDGPVGVDECATVSRFLSHALDVEDPISGPYRLEVSSPGLDRPLRSPAEFGRFTGQVCRVKLTQAVNGDYVFVGHIRDVTGTRITLELSSGDTQVIEHANVANARLVVEF